MKGSLRGPARQGSPRGRARAWFRPRRGPPPAPRFVPAPEDRKKRMPAVEAFDFRHQFTTSPNMVRYITR